MKTYLQMDGDQLVEYVEKRDYDETRAKLTETQRQMRGILNHLHTATAERDEAKYQLTQQIQDAVKRMEEVPVKELDYIWDNTGESFLDGFEAVRGRLIQAAKGEQS